ncbi:nucleotidyltransferase domain-containing protein [Actinacidiphila epipremni]|uniref:Nucleotidyltransferase domain-containing protein n=1 Tax=Actinacidiphila epipremni TaxID=2053013 RepID=A0ABX0ZSM4_9ACTN|nr:nucleotidyltransferase domain-containing protein [Actinacidiphila epipremni]NJP45962.1 nucleotidyltransferase domain-containing protein [Actinacidiphila epipremni]
MIQHDLIARVRERCRADGDVRAALMYGSFAAGEGDAHSDVEFWLFLTPAARAALDPAAWCAAVAPVNLVLENEFGTHVALFPGPVRGEFHFATTADIASVAGWPARGAAVEAMVVVDRDGALTPVLRALPERPAVPRSPAEIADLCGRFANWLVLAAHVTARGEHLRAQDALAHAARHLLWMARVAEGSTAHYLTPSRAAEAELPARTVAAAGAGTLAALWEEGRERWRELAARTGGEPPAALFAELDRLAAAATARPASPWSPGRP